MKPLTLLNSGSIVNERYEVVKPIGKGGFGKTYLVKDLQRFEQHCVLKQFAPSYSNQEALAKSEELFNREAKVLYQLNHPQIPKLEAYFTWEEQLFLVQEFVEGQNYLQLWEQRRQQGKFFTLAEVVDWLIDLLPVLDYIHQQDLIHRDISPDNVILSHKLKKPVLIDFGIAKTELPGDGSIGTTVGKIGFSAPEQSRSGRCYASSDLYALATTSLMFLTSRSPNDCYDDQRGKWKWQEYVTVDPEFASIINKMLEELPQNRYHSAQQVLKVLQSYRTEFKQPAEIQPTLIAASSEPPVPTVFSAPVAATSEPSVPTIVSTPQIPLAESSTVKIKSSVPLAVGLVGTVGTLALIATFYPVPIVCQVLNNCSTPTSPQGIYDLSADNPVSSEELIAQVEREINQAKTASNLQELEGNRDRLSDNLEELKTVHRNSTSSEELDKYQAELVQLEQKITQEKESEQELTNVQTEINKLQQELENLLKQDQKSINDFNTLQDQCQKLKMRLVAIPQDSLALEGAKAKLQEVEELSEKIRKNEPLW